MRNLAPFVLLLAAACATERPVGMLRTLDRETPAQCTDHCRSMGMHLTAVVVIASMSGCVCEPGPAPAAGARGASAASGGAVAALLMAAQQQQQQNTGRR